MGWFLGMALLVLMQQHSEFLSKNHWVPYVICSGFALIGGIVILIIQKVLSSRSSRSRSSSSSSRSNSSSSSSRSSSSSIISIINIINIIII